jgi:hypothetical protein
MLLLLRLAGATELLLVCAEGLVPGGHTLLPLGGNHLAQIGVVFGLTFALKEMCEAVVFVAKLAVRRLRRRRK